MLPARGLLKPGWIGDMYGEIGESAPDGPRRCLRADLLGLLELLPGGYMCEYAPFCMSCSGAGLLEPR